MDQIQLDAFGIDERLLSAVAELGFTQPTTIQAKAWPILLANHTDLIGLAQTGTGKTAAFGIPLLQLIDPNLSKVQALVICPTRELCLQITEDFKNYTSHMRGIRISAIYGGASISVQIKELNAGVHVVVATPGRLKDMIERRAVNLRNVNTLVFDEADEMLSMGFKDDLDFILSETPSEKQTWLFSATMPQEVERIAANYMTNPQRIEASQRNSGATNIEHIYHVVHASHRYLALKRIADYYPEIYGIIFCRTKIETQQIADNLIKDGYNADALHGDLSQAQRDSVMKKFRMKNLQMLVATDVAARGIDVDNVTHVINYSLPDEIENYTHRSGRTARAGKSGISIAIISNKDVEKIKHLERKTGIRFEKKMLPSGLEVCERQLMAMVHKVHDIGVNPDIEGYLPQIFEYFADLDKDEIIKRFVSVEFNIFLDYYKNAPDLNANSSNRLAIGGNQTRFFINLGELDDMDKGGMVRLICDLTGLSNNQLGKIDIKRSFSFFEVPQAMESVVEKKFNSFFYQGRAITLQKASPMKYDNERSGGEGRRGDSRPAKSYDRKERLQSKFKSSGKPASSSSSSSAPASRGGSWKERAGKPAASGFSRKRK